MRTGWLLLSMTLGLPAHAGPSPQVEARIEAVPEPRAVTTVETSAPSGAAPDGATSPPAVSATGHAIQPPGQFHGDETVALDGEAWLALRVDMDEALLVPATVHVTRVEDPLHDAPGERSGRAVSSAPADDAIRMFLRGPALVAGLVEQARVDMTDGDGRHRFERALAFRDSRYRLRSECTPRGGTPVAGQWQFDCRIVLRETGSRHEQVLVRMDGYATGPGEHAWLGDDAAPELLFAGDLDRDGELDLLFDTTDHYNVARPALFLSSHAGPGELLREVARHEASGC